MNERFKELAEQAGLQPYYDAQEQHIQKFSELLVQKCQSLIEEEASKWRGEEDIANFRLAVHVIKDYFEVDKQSG